MLQLESSPQFAAIRGSPGGSAGKKIYLQCRRPQFNSWVRKICWRRDRLPTLVFLDFSCGSAGKEIACNSGDLSLIPGLGRSPGEGKGYPLQYSGLENSMDYIVHEVAKGWTPLSDFHFTSLRRSEQGLQSRLWAPCRQDICLFFSTIISRFNTVSSIQ